MTRVLGPLGPAPASPWISQPKHGRVTTLPVPPAPASTAAVWWATDIVTSYGDAPTSWTDRVSGITLTASGDPRWRPDAIGFRRPAVIFPDGNDYLSVSASSAVSTATSGCIVAVAAIYTPTTQQTIWSSNDISTAATFFGGFTYTDGTIETNQRNSSDTTDSVHGNTVLQSARTYVLEWASSGTAYQHRVNGVLQSHTTRSGSNNGDWFGDTSGRDNFTIGAHVRNTTGTFLAFDSRVGFLGVYDAPLSDEDRSVLYSWLYGYYRITL